MAPIPLALFSSLVLAVGRVLLGWMSEPLFKGVVDSCTICLGDDEPLSKRSCCSKPICVPCMTKWFEQSQRMLAASASAGAGAASSTSPSSSSSSTSGRSRSRPQSRASSGQKKGAGSSDDTQTVVCPQCRETIPVPNGKIQQDDYMTTVRDTLCTRSDTFDSRFSGECAFVWMCGCVDVCVCVCGCGCVESMCISCENARAYACCGIALVEPQIQSTFVRYVRLNLRV